jgi:hypothetical protein
MQMVGLLRVTGWVVLCLLPVCTVSLAYDGAPEPPPPRGEEARPLSPASRQATGVDPKLEGILQKWEKASARIRRLDCAFSRFTYDKTFDIERRATGRLAIDTEKRGMYTVAPVTYAPGEVSKRHTRDGRPFQLRPDDPYRWHWTGDAVILVDEKERTFEEIAYPLQRAGRDAAIGGKPATSAGASPLDGSEGEFRPEAPTLPDDGELPATTALADPQSENGASSSAGGPASIPASQSRPQERQPTFSESLAGLICAIVFGQFRCEIDQSSWLEAMCEFPIPRIFLLGMKSDELQQRFRIELLKQTDSEVWLQFRPRQPADARRCDRAILILSTAEYKPVAIKLVDVTGREIVHVFMDVRSNPHPYPYARPYLEFPDLTGYRRISPPDPATPQR